MYPCDSPTTAPPPKNLFLFPSDRLVSQTMVPKPMSMNAFKNITKSNHQSQQHKQMHFDSPTGDRRHYHADSHAGISTPTAKMSPALKRSLLNDLRPMMRKMGSSRSLVSLTSHHNDNHASNPSLDDVRIRQALDASPRRLSRGESDGPLQKSHGGPTTKPTSTKSMDYIDQKYGQPSHGRASIRSSADRSKDAIRRASIRSIESITCRQTNRTDHLTKQDSTRSLNSLKSGHSFQQESLDEGDGAPQLRGILLARKAELSASRSDLKLPSPSFSHDNDNDDDISVLSEGDSSIAESLGNSPIKSPQAFKLPIASSTGTFDLEAEDFERIEQEKHELQRMIAQLEQETKEMERKIEQTKNQNNLLRSNSNFDLSESEPQQRPPPQQEYYQQQQQPEYKRFVQPSAALKILSSPETTKKTPARVRPPIDSRQMAGLLAKLESDFPHVTLTEQHPAKVDRYIESPASSIALLEARVHQLTASPRSRISSTPNAPAHEEHDSDVESESHYTDYSSNTEPSSSDELERSQTVQQEHPEPLQKPQTFQQDHVDSFEQDAGEWLIEQIARGNESLSQVSSHPPSFAGPTSAAHMMAGINEGADDSSLFSDSTWTFYTLKSNRTGSNRSSVVTASNYMPKWTVPSTMPPTSYDEIRQYQDTPARSIASSVHNQSGLAMQRVPATPRQVKSDPPERGRPQDLDSPTSTLESSLNPDPPVDINQMTAPLRIQATIPEEDYLEPDTTLPTVISFSSFEKFEDDEVSAMSAKGRKVERTSKSAVSPPPESGSSYMDHDDPSVGNSDSSSELSDVGLMLHEMEDKDQLLKQLHDSGIIQLDEKSERSRSCSNTGTRAKQLYDSSMFQRDEKSQRSRSRSNTGTRAKQLHDSSMFQHDEKSQRSRSRSRSRSNTGTRTRKSNRIKESKPKSTDEEKTKKKKKLANARELLERSKLASTRKVKNENSDVELEPPKPISTLSLDTKRSTTKSSKTKRAKSSDRTKSRSPRPSKAKELDEVPVVKDRIRSKSADRGIERTKSDKKNDVSKSRSRSKSTERILQKFSSTRSIESSKSKSSKASRATSLSPPPPTTRKDDKGRLRSKSKDRALATNDVGKKEKLVSRGLDKSNSLDNVERVARAAKVLERARSSRRDTSEEPKLKRTSSKGELSAKSRHERSSSKEKKRTKSKEGSSRKGTRRSTVSEISNHSRDRSLSSERSLQKESSKSTRKVQKSASTTLKRPKSTESIGLRATSKRNETKLQGHSLQNDRFFLDIPKARSNDDLLSFSLSGNKTSAMSRYFEKSRKKDYLSYTTH